MRKYLTTAVMVLGTLLLLREIQPTIAGEVSTSKMSQTAAKAKKMTLRMKNVISISDAVEIAYKVAHLITIPDDAPIEIVFRSKTNRYVVQFKTELPPGIRGADYHAQVTLDATTGKVIQVWAGS